VNRKTASARPNRSRCGSTASGSVRAVENFAVADAVQPLNRLTSLASIIGNAVK